MIESGNLLYDVYKRMKAEGKSKIEIDKEMKRLRDL